MKKKYLFFISLFILSVIDLIFYNHYNVNNVYEEEKLNNSNNINKGISMNLEQTAGAGDYKTVTQSEWPTEGYKFNAELSKCENGSTISWDDTLKAIKVNGRLTDKCNFYFDKILSLSSYIISQYTGTQGENSLYYHDSNLENGAGDNSYRYAGANPNNYVCFGSGLSPCPTENLYRIIGVFDNKVKLIKYDYANSNLLGMDGNYFGSITMDETTYKGILTTLDRYQWSSSDNVWSKSNLNIVNLNTNYIANIGTEWVNKIATTAWKAGGAPYTYTYATMPTTAYKYEVGSGSSSTTYDAKIGLMYVSDYYYAASPSAWALMGNNSDPSKDYRSATDINWMYMGYYEWTISSLSDSSGFAFGIYGAGYVNRHSIYGDYGCRPTFYLNASVGYSSGSGTMDSPIILS